MPFEFHLFLLLDKAIGSIFGKQSSHTLVIKAKPCTILGGGQGQPYQSTLKVPKIHKKQTVAIRPKRTKF